MVQWFRVVISTFWFIDMLWYHWKHCYYALAYHITIQGWLKNLHTTDFLYNKYNLCGYIYLPTTTYLNTKIPNSDGARQNIKTWTLTNETAHKSRLMKAITFPHKSGQFTTILMYINAGYTSSQFYYWALVLTDIQGVAKMV